MTFKMEKTGKHLRATALHEGAEERMRALQALSYGFNTGSHSALARMLLATLGGSASSQDLLTLPDMENAKGSAQIKTGQVAHAMQESANDMFYRDNEASTGR